MIHKQVIHLPGGLGIWILNRASKRRHLRIEPRIWLPPLAVCRIEHAIVDIVWMVASPFREWMGCS